MEDDFPPAVASLDIPDGGSGSDSNVEDRGIPVVVATAASSGNERLNLNETTQVGDRKV